MKTLLLGGLFICVVIAAVTLIQALLFYWAWNILVVSLFATAVKITFIKSLAAMVLVNFILNGLRYITGGFFKETT